MDRRLLMLSLGMFAMGTDNFVVAGILRGVASSLHVSVSVAGQMVSIYALSFAILAPVMAMVGGNWPRKAKLIAALTIFVLGNALTAIATDITVVLVSRAIAGLGAAMFSPTALGVAATIVPPERKGRALSIVTAGLAGATALGAPIGTFIGGIFDWRTTLWFVALVGLIALLGLALLLHAPPRPHRVSLGERLRPLADSRVLLTLATTLLAFGAMLTVYTYSGLVFDRVTHGDPRLLAGLFLLWGLAATCGNLISGRLVDSFDSRLVINGILIVEIINFALMPYTSANLVTAIIALIVWACGGWGLMVPMQHRLVETSPKVAPVLLAWYNSAFYSGLGLAAICGGLVILVVDPHHLGWVSAGALTVALVMAELTRWRMTHHARRDAALAVAAGEA